MVVISLSPQKFYGTGLPRPRIYTDVKFNDGGVRVDPPAPVTDPLMCWANEAHWSMGGLSFKRLRLQGKIEGNVHKLRAERENFFKKLNRIRSPIVMKKAAAAASVSPPAAPVRVKRRRFLSMIEEEEEEEIKEAEEVEIGNRRVRRRLVKKLGDEFEE